MIHFQGTETFTQSAEQLFPRLTDAAWLASVVPDADVVESSADKAMWNLKPKLSFLTGSIQTSLVVSERHPHDKATYKVTGKAIGSGSTVVCALTMTPADNGGTTVQWTSDITELNGLLKMVPAGLIQSAAQKIIADIWTSIRTKLG